MATVTEAVRAFLLADGTVGGLVATRIYPAVFPQGAVWPAIRITVIDGEDEFVLSGPSGFNRTNVQIDCVAETYSEMETLGRAVTARLNGFKGVASGLTVRGVYLTGKADLYSDAAAEYGRALDFRIYHEGES